MLTALLILVLLLLAVVVVLLFMPMVLMINTVKDLYRVQWGPAWAALSFREERVHYRLHLPFYTCEGELHALLERPADVHRPAEQHQHAPARAKKGSRWRPPLRALLRTFRLRRLHWNWDTGDPLWNAWLFPLFHLLRLRGHEVAISFTGRNELILVVDNNLYRLLKAVLLNQPKTQVQ